MKLHAQRFNDGPSDQTDIEPVRGNALASFQLVSSNLINATEMQHISIKPDFHVVKWNLADKQPYIVINFIPPDGRCTIIIKVQKNS